MTLLSYVLYEIFILRDGKYSKHPICPYSNDGFTPWYSHMNSAVCGGFATITAIIMYKLFRSSDKDQRIVYAVTLCIICIGFVSSLLALCWNWGGVCIDSFG